jgi:GNAT superfamily N-acetyltransferase
MPLEIRPLALPTPAFDPLLADSLADRQSMLQRLWKEWKNGGNRFALLGEALFGAWRGEKLVGLCGLNRDPYGGRAEVGRVRHLYVHREHRRSGVARSLVGRVMDAARPRFLLLELRTISPEADLFYRSLGFAPASRTFATHELALRASYSSTVSPS